MAYSRIVRDLEYQDVPELYDNYHICRNVCPRGGLMFQLYLVENEEVYFVGYLPQKFDKKIMFGRGDLCICTVSNPYSDEIGRIDMLLTKSNVRDLVKLGTLPPSAVPDEDGENAPEMCWESSSSYY